MGERVTDLLNEITSNISSYRTSMESNLNKIKVSLTNKGVDVTSVSWSNLNTKIDSITSGGGGSTLPLNKYPFLSLLENKKLYLEKPDSNISSIDIEENDIITNIKDLWNLSIDKLPNPTPGSKVIILFPTYSNVINHNYIDVNKIKRYQNNDCYLIISYVTNNTYIDKKSISSTSMSPTYRVGNLYQKLSSIGNNLSVLHLFNRIYIYNRDSNEYYLLNLGTNTFTKLTFSGAVHYCDLLTYKLTYSGSKDISKVTSVYIDRLEDLGACNTNSCGINLISYYYSTDSLTRKVPFVINKSIIEGLYSYITATTEPTWNTYIIYTYLDNKINSICDKVVYDGREYEITDYLYLRYKSSDKTYYLSNKENDSATLSIRIGTRDEILNKVKATNNYVSLT